MELESTRGVLETRTSSSLSTGIDIEGILIGTDREIFCRDSTPELSKGRRNDSSLLSCHHVRSTVRTSPSVRFYGLGSVCSYCYRVSNQETALYSVALASHVQAAPLRGDRVYVLRPFLSCLCYRMQACLRV